MLNALLALAVVLAPALVSAGEKYVVRNGRAVPSGAGTGGRVAERAAQGGVGAGTAGAIAGAPVYADGGGQAFLGGGRRAAGGHRSFYGGRREIGRAYRVPQRSLGGGTGDGDGTETPAETPGYFKPGALIRTEGQKPQFAQPSSPERQNTVSAGEIAMDSRRAHDVGRSPGVRQGPPDTPPGRNPGSNSAGSSGGNSITANVPVIVENTTNNGAHDNQNGGGNARGNGGGTGFDPSF